MIVPPVITSRQNEAVKRARALAHGKDASTSAEMCVEGARMIEDALTDGVRFVMVLASPRLEATERGAALRERLLRSGNPMIDATDSVLESISEAAGDQGVVGVAYKKLWKFEHLLPAGRAPLVVAAWGVQDPGNLGTIIRTADAAGATGLVAAAHGASPYNTKSIRATMGAIFRLPVIEHHEDPAAARLVGEFRRHKLEVIGTSLAGGERHVDVDLTKPVAIVMGGEGGGLPDAVLDVCDRAVRIPIRRGVESLNVASAAAVLLYEAARQRGFAGLV